MRNRRNSAGISKLGATLPDRQCNPKPTAKTDLTLQNLPTVFDHDLASRPFCIFYFSNRTFLVQFFADPHLAHLVLPYRTCRPFAKPKEPNLLPHH